MFNFVVLCLIYCLAFVRFCDAAVVEYENKTTWENDSTIITSITFAELPANTLVTTQYSYLGVTFTDGSDFIYASSSFLNDGVGLNGAFDDTWLAFSESTCSIAVDYPGAVQFLLYFQGQLLYTSSIFLASGSGAGAFAGLISDQPFDQVRITDPTGDLFFDDLHFGPPVSAPSAVVTLIVALSASPQRRRRCSS